MIGYTRIYLSLLLMLIVVIGYLYPELLNHYSQLIFSILVLILLLFVPGYWISLLFFDIDDISGFERTIMSLMISCSLIPFLYWYIQYFFGHNTMLLWGYNITVIIIFLSMLAVIWKIDRID